MSNLFGPDGRPVQLPLQNQVEALRSELHSSFGMLQQLRMELVNQALKTQFLIKKLTEIKALPVDMNEEFQVFVQEELKQMEENSRRMQEQAERQQEEPQIRV